MVETFSLSSRKSNPVEELGSSSAVSIEVEPKKEAKKKPGDTITHLVPDEYIREWKAVISDLYNFEYRISGELLEASVKKLQYSPEGFDLHLEYPQAFEENYQKLMNIGGWKDSLTKYFFDIVQVEVTIEVSLSEEADSKEVLQRASLKKYSGQPEYQFRLDQLENPLLVEIESIFKTQFLTTQIINLKKDELSLGGQDEYAENDETNAENAEGLS